MILVTDITNGFPIAVADDETLGLELAKKYVKTAFEYFDGCKPEMKSHFEKDVSKLGLIGISLSDIEYNTTGNVSRTNYFFGHIKRDGTVYNQNDHIGEDEN